MHIKSMHYLWLFHIPSACHLMMCLRKIKTDQFWWSVHSGLIHIMQDTRQSVLALLSSVCLSSTLINYKWRQHLTFRIIVKIKEMWISFISYQNMQNSMTVRNINLMANYLGSNHNYGLQPGKFGNLVDDILLFSSCKAEIKIYLSCDFIVGWK